MKFETALDEALWKRRKPNLWLVGKTGLQPSTISRYRRGIGAPTLDHFILLCSVLPELRAWFVSAVKGNGKA